jgi:hypothetical protein
MYITLEWCSSLPKFGDSSHIEREMGGVVLVIIAASLLMGCTNLALAEKDLGVMHVAGKVLCQDCTQGWHEWAHGGKPIKGTIK